MKRREKLPRVSWSFPRPSLHTPYQARRLKVLSSYPSLLLFRTFSKTILSCVILIFVLQDTDLTHKMQLLVPAEMQKETSGLPFSLWRVSQPQKIPDIPASLPPGPRHCQIEGLRGRSESRTWSGKQPQTTGHAIA